MTTCDVEQVILDAIRVGFESIQRICAMIGELREKAGKACTWTPAARRSSAHSGTNHAERRS